MRRGRLIVATPARGRWWHVLTVLYGLPAIWLVYAGLRPEHYIGHPAGETWGRLFVTGQVSRWFSGESSIFWADLLAAPEGRAFWPVDPVLQLALVPLCALFGDAVGWALGLAVLSISSALGGYALARVCGAGIPTCLASGLMLQLHPLWLRHAAEGVTEVLALGPPALLVAAAIAYGRRPTSSRLLIVGLAVAGVAGTSPYYAVFGAVLLVVGVVAQHRHWRRGVAIIVVLIGVGVLFLLPFLYAETGAGGRLSATWQGGYQLSPDQLVVRGARGLEDIRVPGDVPFRAIGGGQSAVHQVLVQWPGAISVSVILVWGLFYRPTRLASGLALLWLALGPGWSVVLRWAGWLVSSPLELFFGLLPGTRLLGNPVRMVVIPIIVSIGVAGLLSQRWRRAVPLVVAVLAVIAALVEVPTLRLPVVENPVPYGLFPGVQGPVATWPDGDPPLWNPDAHPKGDLWLATHHGGPQAFDYGRGSPPADEDVLVALSLASGVPVGRAAAELHELRAVEDSVDVLRRKGFRHVLVLHRTLDLEQRRKAHIWLTERLGPPAERLEAGARWDL